MLSVKIVLTCHFLKIVLEMQAVKEKVVTDRARTHCRDR